MSEFSDFVQGVFLVFHADFCLAFCALIFALISWQKKTSLCKMLRSWVLGIVGNGVNVMQLLQ
jgi:hypothetical protein